MFIGVQQSTCQVLGIVLGTWGYINVGDTSLGLNKLCLDGRKTDLQKVMMKSEAAASTVWCACLSSNQSLPTWSRPSPPDRRHFSRKPSQIPHLG